MNRSLGLLLGTTVATLLVACSAGTDSTELAGSHYGAGSSGTGNTSSSGSMPTSSSSSSGAGSSSGTATTSSSSGGTVTTPPPPTTGPGSTSSQAHQYFDSTVYPEILTTCAPCHSVGTDGAPEMMQAPADTTYSELDAMGLIQTSSLLLTKGSHDNGSAPVLTTQETTDITTWLGMEAQEASGGSSTPAPNVLAEIGACVSMTDWNNIPWSKLQTQPRTDENADKCSGCNYALCASCHTSGEQGFFMDEGTAFDPTGSVAYQETFQSSSLNSYIIQYFGLNGTTPIASGALATWQKSVAAMPAYSHPMFVLSTDMTTAIGTMVTNALTAYTNHTCTLDGGAAGAGEDGGP